ncbi:preprotein translocase subunit SecG [Georgenia sp. Z1344]|uniref:preprotein translocase subunit SecG n=1 Tax=Georgenia sp. Z1344 TaxID=3416706 RepID=UPI003CF0669B
MIWLKVVLSVLLVLLSIVLVLFVLMHKGRGGGLSDMFGGGLTSSVGSSGVAERNLNRLTVGVSVAWGLCVVMLGLIMKFGD